MLDGAVRRKTFSIGLGGKDDRKRDLFHLSGGRQAYEDGWKIVSISQEGIHLANGRSFRVQETAATDRTNVFRAQIRETIRRHIERIALANAQGVKVLSLFFLDRVAHWDADGGIVRHLFREEIEHARNHPGFPSAWKNLAADDLAEAYFASKTRKDGTFETIDTAGRQNDAEAERRAYDLIMRGKEDLLSNPCPADPPEVRRRRQVCFIVSHSALREGWDNPNVFQICTLADAVSTIRKRQEIGRGLRIPVNQDGHRVFDPDLNVLSVIANQSYEAFVRDYQKECEHDGIGEEDRDTPINGNCRRKSKIRLQPEVIEDPAFRELWNRISQKTAWTVSLDSDNIVRKVHDRLEEILRDVHPPRFRLVVSEIHTPNGLIVTRDDNDDWGSDIVANTAVDIPDIIELIANALCRERNRLALSSRTIARICAHPKAAEGILKNPTQWASRAARAIREVLEIESIEGIRYERTGDIWESNLISESEREVLSDIVPSGPRGLTDHTPIDSHPEARAVAELRDQSAPKGSVRAFFKIPRGFFIDTPLGRYTPDFAIVRSASDPDKDYIYLLKEVKGIRYGEHNAPEISDEERRKIQCGHKHAEALDDVKFISKGY